MEIPTAEAVAILGTITFVLIVLDLWRTGGRNVAEFMRVKPGFFEKGDAKAINGVLLMSLIGPIVGTALLLGVDGSTALAIAMLGVIGLSLLVGVLILTWAALGSLYAWLARK